MRRNQALTFIKPHAVRNQAVLTYILDEFKARDIEVVFQHSIGAEEIEAGALMDRHYAANARRGTFDNAAALELKDEAKEIFRMAFEEEWDAAVAQGKVFSGEAARKKLGNLSGEALNAIWARHGASKLSGGCYVAWLEDEGIYVVNGFYPSIREQFTAPGAELNLMVVAFDMPWAEFRRDVIGSTNPAAADENSIRGYAHDHAAAFGMQITSRDNVIHASASPFEALCETLIWLPERPLGTDPLWKRIHKKSGLSAAALTGRLLEWHALNPIIELEGAEGPVLDLLEDRDTPEVAAALLGLLE